MQPRITAGQIWRDRDKRSLSGNRLVKVTRTERDGDRVSVYYVDCTSYGRIFDREYRSRYDRFPRAFSLVRDVA
jgi:hypothetical protein